jgi:hypothetical protein
MRNTRRPSIAVLAAAIGFTLAPALRAQEAHQVLPLLRTLACRTMFV